MDPDEPADWCNALFAALHERTQAQNRLIELWAKGRVDDRRAVADWLVEALDRAPDRLN